MSSSETTIIKPTIDEEVLLLSARVSYLEIQVCLLLKDKDEADCTKKFRQQQAEYIAQLEREYREKQKNKSKIYDE